MGIFACPTSANETTPTVVFVRGNENQSIKATVEDAIRLIRLSEMGSCRKARI